MPFTIASSKISKNKFTQGKTYTLETIHRVKNIKEDK